MTRGAGEAVAGRGPRYRVLRLLATNLTLGIAVGLVFTIAEIAVDLGGLRSLITQSALAIVMLCFMNALTFGGLAMAASVMALPREG